MVWKKVRLGDISKISSGNTPLRSEKKFYENGTIPWVKTMDLNNGNILATNEKITPLASEKCKPYPAGTLLVAMYGGFNQIGRTGLLTFPASVNQALAALLLDENVAYANFVQYYLNANVEKWRTFAASSRKDPNITSHDVENFQIILPPLAEQKKIAETLSVWDSAIEKMEKLIENKEMLKKHVFFELTSSQQQSWEKHILSEFLIPGDKKPVSDTSAYKKITVKLHKKGIEFNQQTREMADTRPFYVRRKGELIIGKQNYFNGSIAIVDELYDGSICSNAIMSFKIKNVNSFFLYELLSDESYLHKHEMLANGTGQKELSEKDFLNFEIYIPSPKEQNRIAEILNIYEKELSLLKQQLALYKKQKQGLMQKLLTGEWRV